MNKFCQKWMRYARISLRSPFFWGMLVLAICFVMLGQWQVCRAKDKSIWIERQAMAPSMVSWQQLFNERKDLAQTNIHLKSGYWLKQGFIKDRIVFNDQLGFQIYRIFCGEVGCVLVNLGWAAKDDAINDPLPEQVAGVLRRMPHAFIKETWPLKTRQGLNLVVNLDQPLVQQVINLPVAKYEIVVDPISKHFIKMANPSVISVARHYGYAVQFYLFALVIIFGYIYFIKNDF